MEKGPTFVWSHQKAKQIFQIDRLWPTYVGAKSDESKKVGLGDLPVALWKEQTAVLFPKNDTSDDSKRGTKRKLDTGTSEEHVGGVDSSGLEDGANKRSRDGWLELLGSSVARWLEWGSTLLFRRTPIQIAEIEEVVQPASALETSRRRLPLPLPPLQEVVFSDLHRRAYFVGPGDAYGGDYNIYKDGDPSNSHSTATVRLIYSNKVSVRDLLAYSRVQNQVAKSAVLSFRCESQDERDAGIAYLVFNFSSVSDRL